MSPLKIVKKREQNMEMKRNVKEKKRNTDSQTREIYVVYVRENSNESNAFNERESDRDEATFYAEMQQSRHRQNKVFIIVVRFQE